MFATCFNLIEKCVFSYLLEILYKFGYVFFNLVYLFCPFSLEKTSWTAGIQTKPVSGF